MTGHGLIRAFVTVVGRRRGGAGREGPMAGPGVDALAGLLAGLKDRSGLSYTELAKRTHISSSTVHRYCTGKTLPADFQTVIAIATVCRATDRELTDLVRFWRQATNSGPAPEETTIPRKQWWVPSAAVLLISLLLIAGVSGSGPATTPVVAVQQIYGPAWQRAQRVDPALFGITVSSSTGVLPGFRVGSVRFWDSRTRWASIQPRPGVYDWSILDRLVASAQQAGLPALFVLGGTPPWAAPNGPKAPYDDGSRSAPPDNLDDWDRFVSALVTRYQGRLAAYELWPQGNEPNFYSGSPETLVEMTRRAQRVIKSVDPGATVVCPSMARLWTPEGRALLQRFAQLRGYDHCDVAGVKLHPERATDPPETVVTLLNQVYDTMHAAGVHPPLWNTGTAYELPLEGPFDEQRTIDYAARFYLTSIYGTNNGLQRAYFYNFGGARLPIAMQVPGGPPTRAALAVEELQRWLANTTTRSCGHGRSINMPDNVWRCDFETDDNTLLTILWTHAGTAHTTAGPNAQQLRQLDGSVTALNPGDDIELTGTPRLVINRSP